MYVPQEMLLSMGGVMKAMTKLLRMGQYVSQAAMIILFDSLHPVRAGTDRCALRSDAQREDLSNQCP